MLKRMLAFASLVLLLAAPANAQGPKGGIGFHAGGSPFNGLFGVDVEPSPTIGLRHWLNSQVAVDFGLGYSQLKIEPSPQTLTGFSFALGVPISLKKVSDKVNFILRPGFQWSSLEDDDSTFPPAVTVTTIAIMGELEVEWMVAENLSISAAHGIAYRKLEDDFTPKTTYTSFGTTGSNFTNLGFHVYLW